MTSGNDHRLLAPAVGTWGAAAVCTFLAPMTALVVAVVAIVGALLSGRRHGVLTALAVGVSLGALTSAWHVRALRRGPVPALAERHASVDVIARLVRDPVTTTTSNGARLTLVDATVTAVLDGGWRSTSAPILALSYASGWGGLLPGQHVELVGRLSSPRGGDDVAAVLDARGPPVPIGRPPWWQRAAGGVRLALRRACAGLPDDERGLLPGLVDGDVAAEPASLTADMRLTGLTHLQAVSGENVSVVLAVMFAVCRSIGLRRRSRIAVSALSLLGFVVLARPSASVLRAAVMGGIMLLGLAAGRRIPALPALAAAVIGLVTVNPFLSRAVGFVLSVVATAAILTIAPAWTERLARRVPRSVAAAIAVPAAAQLACTPVLVLVFGQLTPYAVPANLLAAPAVVPATVVGVATAVMATPLPGPATLLAWVAAVPTSLITMVARGFAAVPGAGLTWTAPGWLDVVLAVIVAVVISVRVRRNRDGTRDILGPWQP
jgi:competence protein ComEC